MSKNKKLRWFKVRQNTTYVYNKLNLIMRNKLLFSEQIANSTFSIEFIKVLSPIVSKHIKIYSEAKKENVTCPRGPRTH